MDLMTELLVRIGGLAVFGIAFISFVYWVTQIAPERAERKQRHRLEKKPHPGE